MHYGQVSMAVLLDNFLSASTAMEREERREEQGNAKLQTARDSGLFLLPLEPLLLRLARDYVDSADLDERLASLYRVTPPAPLPTIPAPRRQRKQDSAATEAVRCRSDRGVAALRPPRLGQAMDVESKGGLDAYELRNGMRKLVREPR